MKVTLLIDNLGSGGAQRQIVLLASSLDRLGLQVTLITYSDNEHMLYMLEGTNVDFVKLPLSNKSKIEKVVGVVKYLNVHRPRFLISYLNSPNIIAFCYAFLNRDITWVASERNISTGRGLQCFWRKVAFMLASHVVSNSYSQEKWLLENNIIPSCKSSVIWNGIYDVFFVDEISCGFNANNIRFISLGRLSYQKNPDLLVSAVEELVFPDGIDIEFFWFGDDDPDSPDKRSQLEKIIDDKDLPITINFSTKSPEDELKKADCLILTSRYEGTPNVVLEAMASGVFVIAPDIVDLSVILGGGDRGFIYEEGDVIELTNRIDEFLSLTREKRQSITSQALQFANQNFKATQFAESYLRLLV